MSIATVVTRGFGTFGTIPSVVVAGYGRFDSPVGLSVTKLRGRSDKIHYLRGQSDRICYLRGRNDWIEYLDGLNEYVIQVEGCNEYVTQVVGCAAMSVTENVVACYGEAKRLEFTVRQRDGTVEDITGWTFGFELVEEWGNGLPPLVTKSSGSGGIVVSYPLLGKGYVTLTSNDLSIADGSGLYQYAISRTDAGFEAVTTEGSFHLREPRVAGT